MLDTFHISMPMVVVVFAMALSMLIIPVVWRFASRLGLIDEPDSRKVHTTPVPRVGGWGIAIGALIPILAFMDFTPFLISYVTGAIILFCFGALDDTQDVGHSIKFVGQFLAAGIVVFYGDLWIQSPPFFGYEGWSATIGKPLTFIAIVGMINASNHADGLDGLAGGVSLLSLLVIAYLAFVANGIVTAVIAAATIGGILGFLRYNTHPAEIFMGDTGSTFLGFTLAVLAVHLTQIDHTTLSPALPLLLLGLPTIDLLAVFYLRVSGGMNWFKATRNHVHHRILDLGFEHYEAVIIIYSIQALLVISAIFLRYQSDLLIIVLYVLTAAVVLGLLTYAERTNWQKSEDTQSANSLGLTVNYFRAHTIDITQLALQVIGVLLPIYLLIGILLVEDVSSDFGIIASVLFAIMLADLFFRKSKGFFLHTGAYITVIFIGYLTTFSERFSQVVNFDLTFSVLIAMSIAIVVRYSTDKKFQTSPMDYLIVFGVLAMAVFGGRYLQAQGVGIMVVKTMIMLYGCEVLYTHVEKRFNFLNISAIVVMAIMGYRGLF